MKTQRILFTVLALALSLGLMFGCSSDSDPTDPGDGGGNNGGDTTVGSISGVITQANGVPMNGASVSAGGLSTTTNEDGYFVLAAVPVGETLVAFSNTGYLSTFRLADVNAAAAFHFPDIVLVASESASIPAASGGEVATVGGTGRAVFEANSFVTAEGGAYDGPVTVTFNALTPGDDEFYGSFPGDFAGVREDGSVVPLVSFGFMAVEITGADKAPLSLANGMTAELNLSIDPSKAVDAPATIPMWYYDETEGVWREEGEATLDGNTYTTDVAHFSTWNWDVPVTDICSITGVVHNDEGSPVEGARVLSRGVDAAIMADTYTAADGTFTVNALKNSETQVWAVSGSRTSAVQVANVAETCPVELATPLVLAVPAYAVTLNWGEDPSDLDSHLYIPMTWDDGYDYCHVYYSNDGLMGEDPYAALDTDDTSSYGPEVITGTRFYNGRFQYWVHDYSTDSSANLQASEATVQLEVGGAVYLFEAADVALEGADDTGWWHVFDLVVSGTGADLSVETVMEFQPEYTTGMIYEGDKAAGSVKTK